MRSPFRRRRGGYRGVSLTLVALVCGFLILSSVQEKLGLDLGLPGMSLPALEDVFGGAPAPPPREESEPAAPGLAVHFLDVGQGNSILLAAPGANVLIDAGERGRGDSVLRYLAEQGVRRLDLIIGTHPHSDHIGGLAAVLGELEAGEILLPALPEDIVPASPFYTELLEAVAFGGLSITAAEPGLSFDLGGGAALTVLAPAGVYDDLNNYSVVCRVDYGKTSFLFAGDAERRAEADILESGADLAATVLCVGHHGSETSTSRDFLEAVAPSVAVISCGQDNSYGHPHRELIERLEEIEARILRTDLHGTVVLRSDGERVGVETGEEQRAA